MKMKMPLRADIEIEN